MLARLRAEQATAGKVALFEQLKSALTGHPTPHAQIAEAMSMTEGAVMVAAHRLWQRYREPIQVEVAQTVENLTDVEDELRDLMLALSA